MCLFVFLFLLACFFEDGDGGLFVCFWLDLIVYLFSMLALERLWMGLC